MSTWDDQKMHRGFRVNVPKCQAVIISVNDIGGYFTVTNFTKQAVSQLNSLDLPSRRDH